MDLQRLAGALSVWQAGLRRAAQLLITLLPPPYSHPPPSTGGPSGLISQEGIPPRLTADLAPSPGGMKAIARRVGKSVLLRRGA